MHSQCAGRSPTSTMSSLDRTRGASYMNEQLKTFCFVRMRAIFWYFYDVENDVVGEGVLGGRWIANL